MKRAPILLKSALVFACLVALVTFIPFAQSDTGKTWAEVDRLIKEGTTAYDEGRFSDAIGLLEDIGGALGKGIREFRKASREAEEATQELEESFKGSNGESKKEAEEENTEAK